MASRQAEEDDFNVEVLKLLLQLAWSDGELDAREAGLILGAARSWGVPEPEVASLKRQVETQALPPAPDLALLRGRAEEVLEAARALIASDGQLRAAETELLGELRVILGA